MTESTRKIQDPQRKIVKLYEQTINRRGNKRLSSL